MPGYAVTSGAANETIRIVPITTPVRDEMIDGVRRLTYYYGTAPEVERTAPKSFRACISLL